MQKILVVDDAELNRELLHEILKSPGIAGTDRASVDKGTVSALIHLRASDIIHIPQQSIMNKTLLIIIAVKSPRPGENRFCRTLKSGIFPLRVIRSPVELQVDFHTLSIAQTLAGISGIQPEQPYLTVWYIC